MKKVIKWALCLVLPLLLTACPDDPDPIEVHDVKNVTGRWAEVTFTNVTTGESVTTGSANATLVQVDLNYDYLSGKKELSVSNDHKELTAKRGDVLRVDYKPYVHFAEEHPGKTKMTVKFLGTAVPANGYSAEYEVGNMKKGIYDIEVAGDCPEDGIGNCTLHETNYTYVRIVDDED